MDYINENPVEKAYIPPKKKEKKKEVPFYNKKELANFLRYAKEYGDNKLWGVFFHFTAFTGCRKGEVLALQWSDIDFKNKKVTISKTLTESIIDGKYSTILSNTTKTGNDRIISLDSNTIKVLKIWKHEQALWLERLNYSSISKQQLIFHTRTNKWLARSSPNDAMRIIAQRAGLGKKQVSPHGLRHTHCSLLFEAGRTIKEVQERLGHESSDITLEIYTHVTENKQEETAEAFMKFMQN